MKIVNYFYDFLVRGKTPLKDSEIKTKYIWYFVFYYFS